MLPALLVLVFAALVGAMVFWAAKHGETVHRNFDALAARLGLARPLNDTKRGLFRRAPEAHGEFRGKPARLFTYSTGSGKSRVTFIALSIRPRASGGLTFEITPQGFGSKIAEFFGAREITVDDPLFDQAWFVRTNQPEFLRAALIPELRARLTAFKVDTLSARKPSFKLDGTAVTYSEAGDFFSEPGCERLARTADVLCDFADVAEVFAQHATEPR